MFKSLNLWIAKQEKRPASFYTLLLFACFTGIFRGLSEGLLAGAAVTNFLVLSYIAFYFHIGYLYALVISRTTSSELDTAGDSAKILNVVVLGIFIGVWPPFFDLLFGEAGSRYLYDTKFEGPFWLFYKPDSGFPIGESVALWASVFFTGYYIRIRCLNRKLKGTAGRVALGIVLVYFLLHFHITLLPSAIYEYVKNSATNQAELFNIPYYIAYWHLLLTFFLLIGLSKGTGRSLLRLLHAIPFVLVCLLAAKLTGQLGDRAYFNAGNVLLVCWVLLIQNDYFDRDGIKLNRFELNFFNVTALMILLTLVMQNNPVALPLLLFLGVGSLYNFNFYRAKNYFYGAAKIEGMWGLSAFLSGMLITLPPPRSDAALWSALLVFGGFSFFSIFKDYADMKKDRRAGVLSLYLTYRKRKGSIRPLQRNLSYVALALLLLPAVLFAVDARFIFAGILTAGALPLFYLLLKGPFAGWKRLFILGVSLYLLILFLGIPNGYAG